MGSTISTSNRATWRLRDTSIAANRLCRLRLQPTYTRPKLLNSMGRPPHATPPSDHVCVRGPVIVCWQRSPTLSPTNLNACLWDEAGVRYRWFADVAHREGSQSRQRMTQNLFVFVAQGVASEHSGYRAGGRHALLIYSTNPTLEGAREAAVAFAHDSGWLHVETQRAKATSSDTDLIVDPILRAAAEAALREGQGLVVYQNELRPDA